MKKQRIGLLLLLAVIVLTGIYVIYNKNKMPDIKLDGLLGGEKIEVFENETFKTNAKKDYGLTMGYRKAGSYDMVREDSSQYDYLFPSSNLALDLFKKNGGKFKKQEIVFNTPIVLYTRKPIAEALEKAGVVSVEDGVSYADMQKLAKMIEEGKTWEDLGVGKYFGNVLVDTTDPNKSNSGNMFLGLLANSLNQGKLVNKTNVQALIPSIKKIYQQLGHMQSSSSDMFDQFLIQGIGAFKIIAGYESQILGYSKLEPEIYDKVKDDLVIIYPSPTVWSSHVYIALTDNGVKGLDMLMDKKTQELAWKDHGFRTIVSGTESPDEFNVAGVPGEISRVMPMPDIDAMQILMDALMEE